MKNNLERHLLGVYKTLRARIELINQAIGHTATQGAETESDIRDLLTSTLPSCYGIGTGKIIGTDGEASNQIDIIIYDTTRPNYLLNKDSKLFLADHVIATIEIKTTFTSGDKSSLKQALDNCRSVKQLKVSDRNWYELHYDNETGESESRLYHSTPPITAVFFLTADDTQKSRDIGGFFSILKNSINQYPLEQQPDLLLSLEHASFFHHTNLEHSEETGEYFSAMFLTEDTNDPIKITGADKSTKAIFDLAETTFTDGLNPTFTEIKNSKNTSKAFVLHGGERIPTDPLILKVGRVDEDKFFFLDQFRSFLMFIHSLESLLKTKTMSKTWTVGDYFGKNFFWGSKYPDDFNKSTSPENK